METPKPDPLATTMGHGHGPRATGPLPPLVATRYAVRAHLASGGLGEVYRVRDLRLERDVALKLSSRGDDRALGRFQREAAITARLEHPAIISVHDRGQLSDGRAWFTMRLVRGRTLGAVIGDFHAAQGDGGWQQTADGTSLRRLIEVLVRLTEAVAYAHQQGVVHCDLKPDNVMVGSFGEVQVMDWGLAQAFQLASESIDYILDGQPEGGCTLAGTPAYMSPEQAARIGVYGPVTDLWGLGGILLEMLAGKPPFGPDTGAPWPALRGMEPIPDVRTRAGDRALLLPAELVELCDAARRFDPTERIADASRFAGALRAWLDGSRRHARALERVAAADARQPRVAALRLRAGRDRQRAAELAAELEPLPSVESWRPIWALEDRAAEWQRIAEQAEAAWKQDLRAALNLDPDLEEAHERLADHYVERVRSAEATRRSAAAARAESQLAVHARARHRPFVDGRGAIELTLEPAETEVQLMRFVEVDRRLVARQTGLRGRGPTCAWSLEHGSYLLLARAPGRSPVRLPIVVERGATWRLLAPGESDPRPLVLPPAGAVAEDEVLIPGGWTVIGGDTLAPDAPPRRRIWIDGFVMCRDPVTVGDWLAFLTDLDRRGELESVRACAPHAQPADSGGRSSLLHRFEGDRLALLADPTEHDVARYQSHDLPVNRIDWHAAMAYAGWRARRDGYAWRLADEFEWEKAARGADGRRRPWGDYILPQWALVLDGFTDAPGRRSAHTENADVSPYGVRGLSGNVRTWCINRWMPGGSPVVGDRLVVEPAPLDDRSLRAVRGSAWTSPSHASRAASRFADQPGRRFSSIGVRLVRPWPDVSPST